MKLPLSHVRVLLCLDIASMKTVIGLDAVSFSTWFFLRGVFPDYSVFILGGSRERSDDVQLTACYLKYSARPLILHK